VLRTFLYLIGSIFVIALMRGVIGIVTKGVAQLFEEEAAADKTASGKQPSKEGFGGELVKCPSCGVFFPPAKARQRSVQGQTLSFCSEDCKAKLAV